MSGDAADGLSGELTRLDGELKRLEAEYNMYFAGRLPRPPWESRARVEAMMKRIDRMRGGSYAERFRFTTLQARFTTFIDLWDRGLRAREEGRSGPFAPPRAVPADPRAGAGDAGSTGVASFSDPARETDKLQRLYTALSDARREAGQEAIPYDRFAALIRSQVTALRQDGSGEVAFRVAIRDGKAALTARVVPNSADAGKSEK